MHNLACLALPGDAFDIDNQQILGRRVAGRSFVQGFASQLGPGECLPLVTFSSSSFPVCWAATVIRVSIATGIVAFFAGSFPTSFAGLFLIHHACDRRPLYQRIFRL